MMRRLRCRLWTIAGCVAVLLVFGSASVDLRAHESPETLPYRIEWGIAIPTGRVLLNATVLSSSRARERLPVIMTMTPYV